MKEQLITFDTAKLAKDKGFNIEVLYGVYGPKMKLTRDSPYNLTNWNAKTKQQPHSKATSVPTQSLLQKWLRDKYRLLVHNPIPDLWNDGKWSVMIESLDKDIIIEEFVDQPYWKIYRGNNIFEEALEKGLQEALKLIS